MKNEPEIYWVVGGDTNVGKTTIACALIKILNENGVKTVGFKPFAGVKIHESIDFIISKYPKSSCTIYGRDAFKLSLSSPLTNEDMVETLTPIHYLVYPEMPNMLMLRTGSRMLKNMNLYRTHRMEELKDRVDIARIIKKAKLPIDRAKLIDDLVISRTSDIAQDKCGASFSFLKTLGCDAMVFEGAGPILPAWKGAPEANHAFMISSEVITFIPNINFSPTFVEGSNKDHNAYDLVRYHMSSKQKKYVEPFYIAKSENRRVTAEKIVRTLLDRP